MKPLIQPISPKAMALAAKGMQREVDKLNALIRKLALIEGRA